MKRIEKISRSRVHWTKESTTNLHTNARPNTRTHVDINTRGEYRYCSTVSNNNRENCFVAKKKSSFLFVYTYTQKILETWRGKYFDMLHLVIQRFISEHWLWTGDRKLEKASGECPHALCRCRRTYNIVGILKSSSLLIPDPQFDENIDIEVEHLIAYHYFLR